MTGLVIVLLLSNLSWFAAYWLLRRAKVTQGNRLSVGKPNDPNYILIQGYSAKETMLLLDLVTEETLR